MYRHVVRYARLFPGLGETPLALHVARWGMILLRTMLLIPLAACLAAVATSAQTGNLVTETVDPAHTVVLSGHRPAWATAQNRAGSVPAQTPFTHITLLLARSPQNEQRYQKLLHDLQDPASPQFHHWLAPDEIGRRFGPSNADIAAVTQWLESENLTVTWVAPSRTLVQFNGSAGDLNRAFATGLAYFSVTGKQRIAISAEPVIPQALAPVVKAIVGLSTTEAKPQHHITTWVTPHSAPQINSSNGGHTIGPADFAQIYDIPSTLTGTGVTIGIVGLSRTNFADLQNFSTFSGANLASLTEIVPPGATDPGPAFIAPPPTCTPTDAPACQAQADQLDAQSEATLDVTRAGSIAPGSKILLVSAAAGIAGDDPILDDLNYLIETKPAPAQIISMSFGDCEGDVTSSYYNTLDTLFSQAAGEGISVFVSSGDSGASGCEDHDLPPPLTPLANSPNAFCASSSVTCVGGTEFQDSANPSAYWNQSAGLGQKSALGYIPEGAWNDPVDSNGNPQLAATGGGVSSLNTPTPPWQTGTGVPSTRAGRYTPDISFNASGQHDGYLFCFNAFAPSCVISGGMVGWFDEGGTSAAAPDMAGITALLDQSVSATTGVGNLNARLYAMASSVPSVFHPVTLAAIDATSCDLTMPGPCNNSVPGAAGPSSSAIGYALPSSGYSEVTGLGSLDVATFISSFSSVAPSPAPATFALAATTVTVNPGSSGSSTITATASNGYAGSISLTCSVTSAPNGATDPPSCSVAGTLSLSANSQTATTTVSVATTAPAYAQLTPTSNPRSYRAGAFLALLLLGALPFSRRRWKTLLSFALIILAVGHLTACGQQNTPTPTRQANPGTTPGTYVITVIGTGSDSAATKGTTTFQLVVN